MSRPPHHAFVLGGSRYLLCGAFEAATLHGSVLPGSVAAGVIGALLRSGHAGLVRRVYAELVAPWGMQRVSDGQVLHWFTAELGADPGRVVFARRVLVKLGAAGMAGLDTAPKTRAERLARQLSPAGTQGLSHRGQGYRLVLARERAQAGPSGTEGALPPREAVTLLNEMAADPARAPTIRALLSEAVALVSPGPGSAASEQLVLVQLPRPIGAVETRQAAPAVTPSQLSKAAPARKAAPPPPVEKTDWIEIRFVDDAGNPIASQAYALTLADGSTREGTLDAAGVAYLAGLVPGICEVTFPGFAPRLAS